MQKTIQLRERLGGALLESQSSDRGDSRCEKSSLESFSESESHVGSVTSRPRAPFKGLQSVIGEGHSNITTSIDKKVSFVNMSSDKSSEAARAIPDQAQARRKLVMQGLDSSTISGREKSMVESPEILFRHLKGSGPNVSKDAIEDILPTIDTKFARRHRVIELKPPVVEKMSPYRLPREFDRTTASGKSEKKEVPYNIDSASDGSSDSGSSETSSTTKWVDSLASYHRRTLDVLQKTCQVGWTFSHIDNQ
jgi:hypothetical protein